MKINTMVIGIAEAILIGIMGVCGTLFLTHFSGYTWLRDVVTTSHQAVGHYLPVIVWAAIFIFGSQSIVLRRKGGGGLLWLVIIISAPALWSFNSLDYLKIFGAGLKQTPELNLYAALGLGLLIMTCYGLLNSMSILKEFRRGLVQRKANPDDIETVHTKSNSFLLMAGGASLVLAAVIAVLAGGIGALVSNIIPKVPWYTIFVGLGCILVLAVYLYWIGSREHRE